MANKQDYVRQITLLNYNDASGEDEGFDFFWKDYTNPNFNDITPTWNFTIASDYSWIVPYSSRGNAEPSLVIDSYQMVSGMTAGKLTATITTSENGVDLVLNTSIGAGSGCYPLYSFFAFDANDTDGLYTSSSKRVNEYTFWHSWIWCAPSQSNYSKHFDTLEECFTHLIYNVRNINIIVDNEDWTERTPDYTWQSVAGVYGKSGHVVFSHVLDDSILTGSDINDLNADAFAFYGATRIDRLIANAPTGTEVTAFYSGDFNHLTVTKGELSLYVTLKMYVEGHIVEIDITKPANTDGWASGFLGYIIDSENQAAKLVYIKEQGNVLLLPTGVYDLTVPGTQDETIMGYIYTFLHGHTDEKSENADVNKPEVGTDPEYQSGVPVTGITKPAYGAYDTGFTTQYRMAAAELKALASTLWSNNFWDNIKKFFEDPREIIVGISLMPVIPSTGSSKEIKAGGISTGVYGLPLSDQYVFDTYGTCKVKAEKGNFLDYPPYTRVTAHLPFVGVHSLDVNNVIGKTLTLKYIFDFMTGCCVAEIDVNGDPYYFFGGSCGMQIPVSAEDYSRTYSSILSAGATLGATLSTMATGGLTAPLAIGSASSMLANGMNSSPAVEFASGGGAINGMIGCKTAFLIIERPKEKVADDQFNFVGKPSFITEKLNNCHGFTKCLSVHLDNIACTGQERQEIERLLLAGVRIENGSETPTHTPTSERVNSVTTFLKCISDDDVIGKSWSDSEGDIVTVESKIAFDNDFLNPVLVVTGAFSAFNYCYIHELNRFYYIGNMVYKTGHMMEIHLKCDVLQSWKGDADSGILSNYAVLERQESLNNAYFSDDMYWTQVNKEVKTIPFLTNTGSELTFSIPEDNYILTIAGGE